MGISSVTKCSDLGSNLKTVRAKERKAEIDHFLANSVNIGFGFEDIVKKTTNTLIKHVGRKPFMLNSFRTTSS